MTQPPQPHLLAQIRDLIHRYFSLEEFRDLCFRLGVNYDDLPGEGLKSRIRELTLRLDRERRLDDLLTFCAHLRPTVVWPELTTTVILDPTPSPFVTPTRNPRQIFLSHARQDADFAHQLAEDLRRRGWQVWIAPDSIRPGEKWVDAINRGLAESGIFLLVLTPDAVNSKWVHSETNVAIGLEHEEAIRFIPLELKSVAAPPLWRSYQWTSFRDNYAAGLERLLTELQPEQMIQIAGLYRQLQQAVERRQWPLAQTLTAQITALYPDYRETEQLLTLAQREEIREQAQQTEAAQIYPQLEAAVTREDWGAALAISQKIETLVPDYQQTRRLSERARRGQWQSQRKAFNLWLRRIPIWGWGGGAFTTVLIIFLFIRLTNSSGNNNSAATLTMTAAAIASGQTVTETATASITVTTLAPTTTLASTNTPRPTTMPTLTVTPSRTPTLTPTSDPNVPPLNAQLGDEWVRPKDGMVMVYVPPPSAPFVLESGVDAPVEGYWIDKYEVNNAQYQLCVDDGECNPSSYANDSRFNGRDHPVVGVSWFDAADYAAWVGGALPTEEEWEYAAAGEAGAAYPWGDEFDGTRLNFCDVNCSGSLRNPDWDDGYAYTAPVGSYPDGESWVGAADMAGNVWEWTDSWWDAAQTWRVLRGGSWAFNRLDALAAYRGAYPPDNRYNNIGFRVVVVRRPPSHPDH